VEFLNRQYGALVFPLRTEDLKVLIEQHIEDLDQFADLSGEGKDVEGITEFYVKGKPTVRISKSLAEDTSRENRLRTTLTHELGHVVFHRCLASFVGQQSLFPNSGDADSLWLRCKRNTILLPVSKPVDWMEWQASYASGAFLIPITELERVVADFRKANALYGPITEDQPLTWSLVGRVQDQFQVSEQAARVRLRQKSFLEG